MDQITYKCPAKPLCNQNSDAAYTKIPRSW